MIPAFYRPWPAPVLAGSPKSRQKEPLLQPIETLRDNENYLTLMDTVEAIGKQHGKTQGQVSLRWLLQKDFIPSVVIGAKSVKQLEENVAAGAGWKLTDEEMKQLDNVSNFAGPIPKYPYYTIDFWNQMSNRTRPKL